MTLLSIIAGAVAEASEQEQDSSKDSITTQPQHDDVKISIYFNAIYNFVSKSIENTIVTRTNAAIFQRVCMRFWVFDCNILRLVFMDIANRFQGGTRNTNERRIKHRFKSTKRSV